MENLSRGGQSESSEDMNARNIAAERALMVSDEIGEIILRTTGETRAAGLEESYTGDVLAGIKQAADAHGEYQPVEDAIIQKIREAKQWSALLDDLLLEVRALEVRRARREQFSEKWWQLRRSTLYEIFETDAGKGFQAWLQEYAEALIAWELSICQKLAQEPFPFETSHDGPRQSIQDGTTALAETRYEDSQQMLDFLTGGLHDASDEPVLAPDVRAILEIFTGRIHLYESNSADKALAQFELARDLVPQAGWPNAALASYHQYQNDPDQAASMAQQAIELSPDLPDGYVGLGLWAESQERWDEAEAFFNRAIARVLDERDPYIALSRLLAPMSGNLCLALAQSLADDGRPGIANRALDSAFSLGINGEDSNPDASAYELKGRLLVALNRPNKEVADAYFEAARRFSWRDEYQTAINLFIRANELNPDDSRIYWSWSSALLSRSTLQEYPYADKAWVDKGIAVWEKGAQIELPDADYSWAYILRSLLNEQRARLPDSDWRDRIALWWEGITYLERAVLLSEWDATRWASLGRLHRLLGNDSTALQATGIALDNGPGNLAALDERMSILVNVGRFPEAEGVIYKRGELERNEWVDGVKAYLLLQTEKYEAARELIDDVIERAPKTLGSIWYRQIRAACYRILEEPSLAAQDCHWIWDRYDPDDMENLSAFSWAAYHLALLEKTVGLLDNAIEGFSKLLDDHTRVGDVYRNLGQCYLIRGDLEVAEENFDRGIELATNVRELDELLHQDLVFIEKSLDVLPHGVQVRQVLDRVKEKIAVRRTIVSDLPSPELELQRIVATQAQNGDTDSWAWIAAQSGLARLYQDEKRWSEAAKVYQLLLRSPDRFPEASIGLKNAGEELLAEANRLQQSKRVSEAIELLQEALQIERQSPTPDRLATLEAKLGDLLCQTGEFTEALAKYSQLLKLGSVAADERKQADAYSRLGYVHFALGDLAKERENIAMAIKLYGEADTSDPGGAVGRACWPLLQDPTKYWALDSEWEAFAEDSGTTEKLRRDLAAAREELANYLEELFQLSEKSGTNIAGSIPLVTPIAVEIADELLPNGADEDSPLMNNYLPEMRERILRDMGVRIPGVRIRSNGGALQLGGYSILLDEVRMAKGSLVDEWRYCPVSTEMLTALNIPESDLLPAEHPGTGHAGCWVNPKYQATIEGSGFEVWDDPLLYLVQHLDTFLRDNLSEFLGVQEVANLLDEWSQEDEWAILIAEIIPNYESRLRFGRALRALVGEKVSIAPWHEILETVHKTGLPHDDVSDAVRSIRLSLQSYLPGNGLAETRAYIPAFIEREIIRWVPSQSGNEPFNIPPEDTQELLSEVREFMQPYEPDVVLVTRDSKVRPFVRQLAELEFPRIAVIAEEELLSSDDLVALNSS